MGSEFTQNLFTSLLLQYTIVRCLCNLHGELAIDKFLVCYSLCCNLIISMLAAVCNYSPSCIFLINEKYKMWWNVASCLALVIASVIYKKVIPLVYSGVACQFVFLIEFVCVLGNCVTRVCVVLLFAVLNLLRRFLSMAARHKMTYLS